MKWIKKVATTPISGMAKVIDSLQAQANERKNAPSIHAVNEALNNLNDNLSEDIRETNTHLNTVDGTLSTFMAEIGAIIYPVGAIYISTDSTSPATLFGGTWERIQDKFLLAAGSIYGAGATGGSATHSLSGTTNGHALTINEMPSHAHNITVSGVKLDTGNAITVYEVGMESIGGSTDIIGGDSAHSHTFTTNAGDTMPPYLAVYVWKRTAL